MNKFKGSKIAYLLGGIVSGIVATLIVAVVILNVTVDDVKTNYGNEAEAAVNVLEKSDSAILQKNYLLAGLTLSSDFQDLLEYGVQNGWWTEEYLAQVLLDDVIPVYAAQYSATFAAVAQTDKVQEILAVIAKLPKEQIAQLVNKLLATNFDVVKSKIVSIAALLQNLPYLIDNIQVILANVSAIINQIKNFSKSDLFAILSDSEKGQQLVNKLTKLKATLQELQGVLAQVPGVLDSLGEVAENIQQTIDTITVNLPALQAQINAIITQINSIITVISSLLADVDSDYHFVAGTNTILGHSFTLSPAVAIILNAIDITIVETSYSNNGTGLNLADDTMIIGQIYFKFESSTGTGIDIVLGNITLTGSTASMVHMNLSLINSMI